MRTLKFKATIGTGTFSEATALNLTTQEQLSSSYAFLTDSTNVRIKLKYVFTDDDGSETVADIQTIDLTQNVLQIVNFQFKLGHVRVTYDDTGSAPSGGTLRINATASK